MAFRISLLSPGGHTAPDRAPRFSKTTVARRRLDREEADLASPEPDRLGEDRDPDGEEQVGDGAAGGDHQPTGWVPTMTRQSAFLRT